MVVNPLFQSPQFKIQKELIVSVEKCAFLATHRKKKLPRTRERSIDIFSESYKLQKKKKKKKKDLQLILYVLAGWQSVVVGAQFLLHLSNYVLKAPNCVHVSGSLKLQAVQCRFRCHYDPNATPNRLVYCLDYCCWPDSAMNLETMLQCVKYKNGRKKCRHAKTHVLGVGEKRKRKLG